MENVEIWLTEKKSTIVKVKTLGRLKMRKINAVGKVRLKNLKTTKAALQQFASKYKR